MSWFKRLKNRNKDKNKEDNKKGKNKKPAKVVVQVQAPKVLKDKYTKNDVIEYQLPLLRTIQDKEKLHKLVITKLRLCCVVFDFVHLNDTESKGIEIKRAMLVEIVEFITAGKWWNENILKELINCMKCNLFRTLPSGGKRKFVKGDEEEEPFQDPSWLHLQLIYELCLRFLISNDIDKPVMQSYLQGHFVLSIIQLFQSEDTRERDYLKTILHRIYGRFMPLRVPIRNEISNECYRYVYSQTRPVHGIAEFLDIFSSIINGFSIPVKNEHKQFLKNVLIPLHKCDKYETYFQQLADCCVLFVNKEQQIASTVLGGLLRYWPYLSPTKQGFFLREMLNVIGALVEHENGFDYKKYDKILILCIDKIFKCMESPHFQVADAAINLWKDTVMLYLSRCEKDKTWRRLFMVFKSNLNDHWNPTITLLTEEVLEYYKNIDKEYWEKLENEYNTILLQKKKDNSNNNNSNKSETKEDTIPLDPTEYKNKQNYEIMKCKEKRKLKWEKINEIANIEMDNFPNNINENDDNKNDDNNDNEMFLEPKPEIFEIKKTKNGLITNDNDDKKESDNNNNNNNNNSNSKTKNINNSDINKNGSLNKKENSDSVK